MGTGRYQGWRFGTRPCEQCGGNFLRRWHNHRFCDACAKQRHTLQTRAGAARSWHRRLDRERIRRGLPPLWNPSGSARLPLPEPEPLTDEAGRETDAARLAERLRRERGGPLGCLASCHRRRFRLERRWGGRGSDARTVRDELGRLALCSP